MTPLGDVVTFLEGCHHMYQGGHIWPKGVMLGGRGVRSPLGSRALSSPFRQNGSFWSEIPYWADVLGVFGACLGLVWTHKSVKFVLILPFWPDFYPTSGDSIVEGQIIGPVRRVSL